MKKFFIILAAIAVLASIAMYLIGSNSSHLTELKDFFWVPLPLALFSFFASKSKN